MNVKKLLALLLAAALLAAACGEPSDAGATTTTEPPAPSVTTGRTPAEDGPVLMGLALEYLLLEANTFGEGHRFDAILIRTSLDPAAGSDFVDGSDRPLTDEERAAIEEALAGLSDDIRWIENPEEWRTDDLTPVIPNSAIIGVGEVSYDQDGALVPVSLWCGGLCGTWFTARAELADGEWVITGPEGPVAVA